VKKSAVAGAFYSARPIEPPNYEFRATVALMLGMMVCVPFATGIASVIVATTILKAPAASRTAKWVAVVAIVLALINFFAWGYRIFMAIRAHTA
jgi:hypothetical protein